MSATESLRCYVPGITCCMCPSLYMPTANSNNEATKRGNQKHRRAWNGRGGARETGSGAQLGRGTAGHGKAPDHPRDKQVINPSDSRQLHFSIAYFVLKKRFENVKSRRYGQLHFSTVYFVLKEIERIKSRLLYKTTNKYAA